MAMAATRTLNAPPAQKWNPNVSFIAHDRLGSLRPSTSRHRFSNAARRSPMLLPAPFPAAALTVHLVRISRPGRVSPLSSLRFHSFAMSLRRVQAASSFAESVADSRLSSIFQRSGTCRVRW